MTAARSDRSPTVEDACELLDHVSANCSHDRWVEIGMAIKAGLGDAGWPVFEEWSQSGNSYDPRTCRSTWDSFQAAGAIAYGTLVHHARAGGWQPPARGARRPRSRRRHPGGTSPSRAREAADRSPGPAAAAKLSTPPTIEVARAILTVAVPADDTPARIYLKRRGTWPPFGMGPDLPSSVRWLEAAAVEALPTWTKNGKPRRLVLPTDAAGAVVFEFACPGQPPDGVSLTAVTVAGNRLLLGGEKTRTFGGQAGRVFEPRNIPGGHLWLVEGECDALALTLCGYGGVIRSVHTGGYQLAALTDPARRNVVLVPDCDVRGDEAGLRFYRQALEANMTRRVRLWPPSEERLGAVDTHRIGGDPADWLEGWFTERAGIREYDGGMSRADADATAWNDVLSAIRRGEKLIPLSREGA